MSEKNFFPPLKKSYNKIVLMRQREEDEMSLTNFGTLEKVSITILVDNKADIIVKNSGVVKYFTEKPLLAEHGFSALILLNDNEEYILWDAGVTDIALFENMRRMELNPQEISMIALSHGHFDHFAAMTRFLENLSLLPKPQKWDALVYPATLDEYFESRKIEMVAHPAAFRERWKKEDDGTLEGPFLPPQQKWEAAGANLILSSGPHQLAPGCWMTGYVPRNSFEKSGRSSHMLYREGDEFFADDMEDDQAVVFNIEEKGLVILSGCAHSGIVNTIEYAREISGVQKVHAVLGGFHLAVAQEDEINQTVDYLKQIQPDYIIPSHCTGLKASSKIAQAMPGKFIEGVVGASYLF